KTPWEPPWRLLQYGHGCVFLGQILPLPARARAPQRTRLVPRPQGGLRGARARAVPAAARRPAAGAGRDQPALPRRPAPGRRLVVPDPARHPLRQRQVAVQVLAGRAPVPPPPPRGGRTLVLHPPRTGRELRRRRTLAPRNAHAAAGAPVHLRQPRGLEG